MPLNRAIIVTDTRQRIYYFTYTEGTKLFY